MRIPAPLSAPCLPAITWRLISFGSLCGLASWRLAAGLAGEGGERREAKMWVTCALLLPVPACLRSMRPALPVMWAAPAHTVLHGAVLARMQVKK